MRTAGRRLLFLTWDGGGNVSVMLGIAAELARRGHVVTVAAPTSLASRSVEVGAGFIAFGSKPPIDPRERAHYLHDVADGPVDNKQNPA